MESSCEYAEHAFVDSQQLGSWGERLRTLNPEKIKIRYKMLTQGLELG
jgi:hypothetical protein